MQLQFRAEMCNAFNHTQFGLPNGNAADRNNFGRVSSAELPRRVQLGLKLLWSESGRDDPLFLALH